MTGHPLTGDPSPFIHPTAIVEQDAVIGAQTRIWHHAHVRVGANIGPDSVLGKNVFVDAGVAIGAGCHVQNNVSIFAGITLEDRVFVGPSAVFTNDRTPRAGGEAWDIIPTLVCEGASIGANATILCGLVIGRYATVAAGAVVTHGIEPHGLVAGVPARQIGWVCPAGHVMSKEPSHHPVAPCPDCGWIFTKSL